jgi:plastocyanin
MKNSSRSRRRLLTLAIAAIVALPLGSARGATTTVIERGVSYVPRQVNVAPGDTVVWTFESAPTNSARHTVTFDDGTDLNPACPAVLLNDCQDTPGETVQRLFAAPGTYPYYCKIHRNQGMVGVVVVQAATTTTAAATTSSTLPRQTTTSSTARASTTSSMAPTTRPLATSSTIATSSTTTTTDSSSVLMPGDPPAFPGDGTNSSAAGQSGGSDEGGDAGTVALIVALLLAVSAAGGYLLWRMRPGRA